MRIDFHGNKTDPQSIIGMSFKNKSRSFPARSWHVAWTRRRCRPPPMARRRRARRHGASDRKKNRAEVEDFPAAKFNRGLVRAVCKFVAGEKCPGFASQSADTPKGTAPPASNCLASAA